MNEEITTQEFPCWCPICQEIYAHTAYHLTASYKKIDGQNHFIRNCDPCETAKKVGILNLKCPHGSTFDMTRGQRRNACGQYIGGKSKAKGTNASHFCPHCRQRIFWWPLVDGSEHCGWSAIPKPRYVFAMHRMETLLNEDEELFQVFDRLSENYPDAARELVLRKVFKAMVETNNEQLLAKYESAL